MLGIVQDQGTVVKATVKEVLSEVKTEMKRSMAAISELATDAQDTSVKGGEMLWAPAALLLRLLAFVILA